MRFKVENIIEYYDGSTLLKEIEYTAKDFETGLAILEIISDYEYSDLSVKSVNTTYEADEE